MYGTFILLVDNDRQSVDMLRNLLESEEFEVEFAYSREAALGMMESRRYTHFIIDYSMPEMKGDELARRIRRQQPWAMRILMTGFGSILSKSVHRKFDFVFEKPAEPRSIIQVIRQKESGDDVKRVDSKNITVSR